MDILAVVVAVLEKPLIGRVDFGELVMAGRFWRECKKRVVNYGLRLFLKRPTAIKLINYIV